LYFTTNRYIDLTGVNGNLRDFNYDELPKKFKELIHVPFYFGKTLDTTSFDTQIPTLEEVFQEFPNVPINIDLKDNVNVDHLVSKVYHLIKKYKREELCVWGSFNNSTARKCYQMGPEIPLMFSFKRVVLLVIFYYIGLLPFLPIKESFLEIPMYTNSPFPTTHGGLKVIIWLLKNLLGNPKLYRYLNGREDFEFCYVEKQINGMMTDRPSLLTDFYLQHNIKVGQK